MPRKVRRETAPTAPSPSSLVDGNIFRRHTSGMINRYPRLSSGHVMRAFDPTALELQTGSRDPGYADASRPRDPFQGHTARLIAELQRRESQREYYGEIIERAALHLQRIGRAAAMRKCFIQTAAAQHLRWKNAAKRLQKFWTTVRTQMQKQADLLNKRLAIQKRLSVLQPWRLATHNIIIQQRKAATTLQQCYTKMRIRWRKTRSWQLMRATAVLMIQNMFRKAIACSKRNRRFRLQEAWSLTERTMQIQRRSLATAEHASYQRLRASLESIKTCGPPKPASYKYHLITLSSFYRLVNDESCCRSQISKIFLSSLFVLKRKHANQLIKAQQYESSKSTLLLSRFQQQIDDISSCRAAAVVPAVAVSQYNAVTKNCSVWCQAGVAAMTEPEEAAEIFAKPPRRGIDFSISCTSRKTLSDVCYTPEVLSAAAELWGPDEVMRSTASATPGLSSLCSLSVTPEVMFSRCHQPTRPDSVPLYQPHRRIRPQSAPPGTYQSSAVVIY